MSGRFGETDSENRRFGVVRNNGSVEGTEYTNQCMWLSILYYLNTVMGFGIDLDELRSVGSRNGTRINGIKEQFDSELHRKSLLNVAETFDLQLHFYHGIEKKGKDGLFISNIPNGIVGPNSSSNIVLIVSRGNHFELVSSIDGVQLYRGRVTIDEDFVPDRELVLGRSINRLNEMDNDQLSKIDELMKIGVHLGRIMSNLTQTLHINNSSLDELENSFDEENIRSLSEEEQIAMISSFQEHKMHLEKVKSDTEDMMIKIKRDMEVIDEQLDMLIA